MSNERFKSDRRRRNKGEEVGKDFCRLPGQSSFSSSPALSSNQCQGNLSLSPSLQLLSTKREEGKDRMHSTMEDIHLKSHGYQIKPLTSFASTPTSSAVSQRDETESLTGRMEDLESKNNKALDTSSLYQFIQEEKRVVLVRKAAFIFVNAALKCSSAKLSQSEERRELKEVESAARLILNNLLLNAWRKDKIQLSKIMHENAQLTISVENLGLQLRVLRHLQCQEKERANEKATEIRTLKNQVNSAQKSLKNAECDLASIQEELRYSREDNAKLLEQKTFLQKEVEEQIEEKTKMIETLEIERRRTNRTEEECRVTKNEYADLRKQVKDLSAQSFQWKERSRSLEIQGSEIIENLEIRDTSLRALQSNFKLLLREREQLKSKKDSLEQSFKEAEAAMSTEVQKNIELQTNLVVATKTVTLQHEQLIELEQLLKFLRTENLAAQNDLYWHKLKNVRHRRAWVNTVNILTTPRLWLHFLFFGSQTQAYQFKST